MMQGLWKVLSSKILIDRRPWIYMIEQNVILPNGKRIEGYLKWQAREYALAVVLSQRGIPLVRQYKHGIESFSMDLPGGYLNENEAPIAAAKRELLEETGLEAENWIHLASLVLDNNRDTSRAHLFLAHHSRVVGMPCPDETEDLDVKYFSWEQIIKMVGNGQINSLPTVTALCLAFQNLQRNNRGHVDNDVFTLSPRKEGVD